MHARDRHTGAAASLDWWGALSRSCEAWWIRTAGSPAVEGRAAARTAELIAFARRRSEFYKDAWRDLPPGVPALSALPIVTKRALMARFDDWVTDRPPIGGAPAGGAPCALATVAPAQSAIPATASLIQLMPSPSKLYEVPHLGTVNTS